jgi:glucose/arabinose dehydrogenase
MRYLTFLVGIALAAQPLTATAADIRAVAGGEVRVEAMLTGLDEPWGIAFLPGGGYLVTERAGRLLHVADGRSQPVAGLPEVFAEGQGGLLDVAVARDFATSRTIFLTFAEPRQGGKAGTALAAARLSADGSALAGLAILWRMSDNPGGGQHFGSRVVEAPDGTLYVTTGDRGRGMPAQDPASDLGKVIRVNRDGSLPADNPFAGDAAAADVWSSGHRNIQGAALDADGRLWTVEHGARGGDEINRPAAGRNHGWPVITYGVNYNGRPIGEGTAKPGLEQPLHYWDPSIAPSGMVVYSGRLFPDWAGDILVGSLKFDLISRLERAGDRVTEAERLFEGAYGRIRDVREAPDGSIWFLSVGDGAAYRITPAPES